MRNNTPTSGNHSVLGQSLLAFAKDASDIETIRAFAKAKQWKDAIILPGDISTAVQYLKTHPSPGWLIVEIPSMEEAQGQLDELAEVCDSSTKVSALGAINEYSFYRWLRSIGVCSYVLKPLTQHMIEEAWHTAIDLSEKAIQGKKTCSIVAVMGARGGVGASTIALNLAGAIAESSGKQVALIDLDPQTGSIALALGLDPSRGLRDALEKPERIDSLFIERVMSRPLKNLAVLSAEDSLHDGIIDSNAASALFEALQPNFDVIVLDCAQHLSSFTRQCLAYAQQVVLVTEMTMLSLRDTLRLKDFLHEKYTSASSLVVANRTGIARTQEILPTDFERGLSAKINTSIPFAPDIYMSHGTHIPAIKDKKNRAIAPLYELSRQLVPATKKNHHADEKPASGLKKFFSPAKFQQHS